MPTTLRRIATRALILALVAGALAQTGARADEQGPPLPKDFRSWTHVRSMVVTDGDHGMYGFHDVYGNAAALKTLRSDSTAPKYPDGAVFVVSIYEVVTRDGMTSAGAKRRDVVQLKDSKATATGGWRFGAFDPTGRRIAIDATACSACHAGAKDKDWVFAAFTR